MKLDCPMTVDSLCPFMNGGPEKLTALALTSSPTHTTPETAAIPTGPHNPLRVVAHPLLEKSGCPRTVDAFCPFEKANDANIEAPTSRTNNRMRVTERYDARVDRRYRRGVNNPRSIWSVM